MLKFWISITSIFRYYKAAWIYLRENYNRFDTQLLFDCRFGGAPVLLKLWHAILVL